MRMPVVSRWLSYNQCEISLCAVRLSETNPPLKFQFSPVIAIYTARTAIFVGVLSQSYSIFRLFFSEGEDRYILAAESIDFTDRWNKYFDEGLLSIVIIRESENIGSGRVGSGWVGSGSRKPSRIKYRDSPEISRKSISCFWIQSRIAKKEAKKRVIEFDKTRHETRFFGFSKSLCIPIWRDSFENSTLSE